VKDLRPLWEAVIMRIRRAALLRRLCGLVSLPPADESADAALLERFVRDRDEAAFAVLVSRHGPMVLRVCRRLLPDPTTADDAFQAAFLVLARRAAAVRPRAALAAWLHGVAYRVALKARAAAARRQRRETPADDLAPLDPSPDPLQQLTARELLEALDEEIGRLPQAYRGPVVLCYLEGRTQEEAARLLGCTPGSVKGRLERGRRRLHARLVRRGLSLPAAFAAAELARGGAAAGVADALARSTIKAALRGAAGKMTAAGVPARAAALAEGVLTTMFLTRLRTAALLLLLTACTATGLALLVFPALASRPPQPGPAAPPAAQAPAGRPAPPALPAQAPPAKPEKFLVSDVWWLVSIDLAGSTIKVITCDPKTLKPYARPDAVTPCEARVLSGENIRIDGKPARFADLVPGIPIRMRIDLWGGESMGKLHFGSGTVTGVETVGGRSLDGVVGRVDVAAGKVTVRDGKTSTVYRVAKDAEVTLDGRRGKLADLKPGMSVALRLSAVYPLAFGITAAGPEVECLIRAVDGGRRTLTVELLRPHLVVPGLDVAPGADIRIGDKRGALEDLRPGMTARVQLAAEADRREVLRISAAGEKK
jgi:RNA polymerase sigma factor (sigma-70 family)